ncbi:MAG: zf-HC2 domain-containing protein [bacterium]
MMKEDCRSTRELLERFLDGELEPQAAEKVAAHLAGCPDCRRELEALEAVDGLVRQDEHPPLADDYWDWHRREVWRRLRTGHRLMPAPGPGRRFAWMRLATVAAGVAAVMIAAVGGWRVLTGLPQRPRPALIGEELTAARRAPEPATPDPIVSAAPRPEAAPETESPVETDRLAGAASAGRPAAKAAAPGRGTAIAAQEGRADLVGEAAEPAAPEVALARDEDFSDSEALKAAKLRRPLDTAVPDLAGRVLALGPLPAAPGPDTVMVGARALVEPDGTVSEVELLRSSGDPAVDSLFRLAVAGGRFAPDLHEGVPARAWVSIERLLLPAPEPDSAR